MSTKGPNSSMGYWSNLVVIAKTLEFPIHMCILIHGGTVSGNYSPFR